MRTLLLIVVSFVLGAVLFGAPKLVAQPQTEYLVKKASIAMIGKTKSEESKYSWDVAMTETLNAYSKEGWTDIQIVVDHLSQSDWYIVMKR
jgi:hypothetical protein